MSAPMDSTLKPSVQLALGRTAAYAVTFGIPLVLVRVFDQAQFGIYKQVFLVVATLFTIGQVGMAESLFYFLPQFPQRAGRFLTNSLVALTAAGLAIALLLLAAAGPLSRWLGDGEPPYVAVLVGLFLLLSLVSAPLEIVLISRRRFLAAASCYAVSELLKATCLLVPVLLFGSLQALLVGAAVFAAVRLAAGLVILREEFSGLPSPSWPLFREQLIYATPFAAYVLVAIVGASWHQYVVAAQVEAAVFAVYAIGCLQIPLVDFVAGPACNVMMVGMRTSLRDGRTDSALQLWHSTTLRIAFVVVPLVVLLLITARELIVFLFTESYAGSVPVFLVFAPALLFSIVQTDGVLRVFARIRLLLVLQLVQLVLVASTINGFMARWALPGAALATTMALGVGKLVALLRIRRLLQVGTRRLLPWTQLAAVSAAALVAAVPALWVLSRLRLPPFGLLAGVSVTFVAAYGAVLLGLWAAKRGPGSLALLWGWFQAHARRERA